MWETRPAFGSKEYKAMDHLTWRFAAILAALIATSALMGASLYEESVLDRVWPRKPK